MGFCIRAAAIRAVVVTSAIFGSPAAAETLLDRARDGDPDLVDKQFRHLAQPSGNDPNWRVDHDYTFAWGVSVNGTYAAGDSAAACPSGYVIDGYGAGGCIRAAVWAPAFGTGPAVDEPFILPTLDLPQTFSSYESQARAIDALGETVVGLEHVNQDRDSDWSFRAVAWSRIPGQSWQASAQATELKPSDGYDAAGARGLSGDGQYAVGWVAQAGEYDLNGGEAALWKRTGPTAWTDALDLGFLNSGDESSANGVALRADGKPVVVGWSGSTPGYSGYDGLLLVQGSDPGQRGVRLLSRSLSWVFATSDPSSNFNPKPFVWTEATEMQPLQLLDAETESGLRGDATAISADAKTIVGWSDVPGKTFANEGSVEAVLWKNTGGTNWSAPKGLGIFDLPKSIDDLLPTVNQRTKLGSVALAVSEHGSAVVGYQSFGWMSAFSSQPRFNLAFIWTEELGTGRYLGDVLTEAGVSLGNWVLWTATGVTESKDSFIVVGDGCALGADCFRDEGDAPGFIARIGREAADGNGGGVSGITTPEEQIVSFGELSSATLAIGTNVGNTLTGLNDMAENHRCIRAQDDLPTSWCFFTFGTATLFNGDGTTSGDQFSGDVGLAHYFTPVTSAGASIGGGVVDTDLHWDGSYRANDLHVGGYLAHIPDTGLRLFGAGVWGDISDVDLTRGYLNGTGMAYSTGDTEGSGWGLLGRIGYGFRAGGHLLTPFAELSFTEASLDGYREDGGPFPTTFQDVETNTTTGRLGILEEADLSPTVRVFGSAAWVHVLDEETPIVRGAVLDLFDLSAQGSGSIADWAEFMSGARYQLTQQGVLSVIGRVSTEFDDFFAMQGRLAYSHTF